MTTLTSPTNESYSIAYSNPNRLQSSGLESTPQDPITDSKKQYIQFEQYMEQKPKNELIIVVEDSFQCKILDVPGMKNKRHTNFQSCPCQKQESNNQIQYSVIQRNKQLQYKIRYLQEQNQRLNQRIECLMQEKQDFVIKHQHFKQIIWKKDETIAAQKQVIQNLNIKFNEHEKDNYNIRFYQQKAKQKDGKIRQLIKKIDKLLQINKVLQSQIKHHSQKILSLQRQIQMNAYNQILQNRVKLKQSISNINKQNLDENHRKSFQNPQRKGRLSNISALQKKIKSSSNTGRLRH